MAGIKHSTDKKKLIINDFKNGLSQSDICKKFSLPKSTVSFIIKKFKTTGCVETIHLGGRRKITTPREDAKIIRQFKKYPQISARHVVEDLHLQMSSRTVQRRAVAAGLKSYRSAKKPYISAKNRKKRINFAKEHLNWDTAKWNSVLFSDASKFNLVDSDGMKRVRRPINKRYDARYCTGTLKHSGGSVMVWGCFSGKKVGPLHKIDGIMDRFVYKDILENAMLPYAEWNMPLSWQFQQDNDPKHTAQYVKQWLADQSINVMQFPPQSPDLNPIENLWEIVNKRISRANVHGNKENLFQTIKSAWQALPKEILANLIDSMPRRCAAVIKNHGYATKY